MNSKQLVAFTLLGLAGTVNAADPQWPLDAQDESDPRVQAFYKQQCDQWTEQSALQGAARDDFRTNCITSAPKVWPVGIDTSDN